MQCNKMAKCYIVTASLVCHMEFSPAGSHADESSLCSSSAEKEASDPTSVVRYQEPSCGVCCSADSGWTTGEQIVAPPIGENCW